MAFAKAWPLSFLAAHRSGTRTNLTTLAPWFFIADVVDAETPRELTVSFVIKWPACGNCGQRAAKFCARCRAPYCSQTYQRGDWQSHRRECIKLVEEP